MTLDARAFSILQPSNNVSYGRQDLPSRRDEQIRDLLLKRVDAVIFARLTELMPHGADQVLLAFAERAASMAARHQDARELRSGILAAAIAQAVTGDPREPLEHSQCCIVLRR